MDIKEEGTHTFKVGDYVQVTSTHGSIGRVIAVRDIGWKGIRYDCRWSYGYDSKGEQITDVSHSLSGYCLVKVPRAKWLRQRACMAFTQNLALKNDPLHPG